MTHERGPKSFGSFEKRTPGLDLILVVPGSTLPHFLNSQLVASWQLGFLIMFLLRLNYFYSD